MDQLEARGQIDDWVLKNNWFNTSEKQQIALIISDAIGLEKPLENPPRLHPEDLFGPLFWGPGESISLAWDGNWTLLQFIEYCENCITDQ